MQNHKRNYKAPSVGFGDPDHNRIVRAIEQKTSRKELRTQKFAQNRKLRDVSVPASPQHEDTVTTARNSRMEKLIKWREERKRKKKMENAKKKPVFKVGIVHHSFYSPARYLLRSTIPINTLNEVKVPNSVKKVRKGITKATEKRLLAKATATTATIQQMTITSKNSTKKEPTSVKKSTPSSKVQKSFAPISHEFKFPLLKLKKIPLFGTLTIEETPPEKGDFFENKTLTECKIPDSNIPQNTLQKLDTQSNDITTTYTTEFKHSQSPKSDRQKSPQRLNASDCDLNDITSELNGDVTLSLDDSITKIPSRRTRSSVNNINAKTLLQNTPISDKISQEEDLIIFSPYLTLSRGKNNARKEQMLRLGNFLSDDIPTKDTVMNNLNISVEEEQRTAQYFKFLVNKETERLKDLCQKWMNIRLEKNLPEDAAYEISQAVGQTNLLISKKFERFRSLVLDCETGRGEMLVTCKDLQGFWDVTYMEVRNCDLRFEKLEQHRNRGWQEEQSVVVKPIKKKQMPVKKQIVSSKSSSLRALIAARRKEMIETLNEKDSPLQKKDDVSSSNTRKVISSKENIDTRYNVRSKSIDGNVYKATPAKRSSSRASLIEKVQFSNSTKRMISPYTVMKISKLYKTPEIQLDDTISYVNSDQTPAKSILKKSEETIYKENRVKSAHKVNFDDQVSLTDAFTNNKKEIKQSLVVALRKIDSLDLSEVTPEECIRIERRLDFEDSDNSENLEWVSEMQAQLNEKQNNYKLPVQNTTDLTDMDQHNNTITKEISSNDNVNIQLRKSPRHRDQHKDMRSTNDIMKEIVMPDIDTLSITPLQTHIKHKTTSDVTSDTEENYDPQIRILRNRVVMTPAKDKMTPKRRKSRSEVQNTTPKKPMRKSSLKSLQKGEIEYMKPDKDNVTEPTEYNKRKSRKSVAFDAETCLACIGSKPVLPMTPHSKQSQVSKRSRNRSRSEHMINEDLISRKTLERLPNRVTRSFYKKN